MTLIGTLCLALLPQADSSYSNKKNTCLGGGVEKKKKAGTNRFVSQAGSLCREVELLLAVSSMVFFQLWCFSQPLI